MHSMVTMASSCQQRRCNKQVLWRLTCSLAAVGSFTIAPNYIAAPRRRQLPSRRLALATGSGGTDEETSILSVATAAGATQKASTSQLTDWVIENLEGDGSSVTSSSSIKAGENDTLPESGILVGTFRILAAGAPNVVTTDDDDDKNIQSIRLLVGRNGWGTGVHPTTRLCLEWLSQYDHVIRGGEVVMDYGCGSGILSIAALHQGAARCFGVDVEAEALVTAERNLQLNGYYDDRFEGLHTREVLPYSVYPGGVDVCVANILVGQLVRPSMVAAIVTNVAPGGLVCFSGIRPHEVDSLKHAYDEYIEEWLENDYAELSAIDTPGSIESYGFDCGTWALLVGRKRISSERDIERMSEMAVS